MSVNSRNFIGAILAPFMLFLSLGIIYFMMSYLQVDLKPILVLAVATSPIWLPIALFQITFEQWMWSVQNKFQYENGRTTIRIKLPQEVLKSPEAMESVFTQIHNTNNPDNLMQTYLQGKHPLTVSFELVSIGGEVRFYANVPTRKVKNSLEVQLYAQYPGIELVEEEIDYTAEIKWDPSKYDMISFHINKKGDEVLPLKTYIDYGMDKQPKEELKFEPMSPMLEYLGSAKPHERIWIQFLMTPHAKKTFKNGSFRTVATWEGRAAAKVDELMGREVKTKFGVEETDSRPALTMSERDTIASIERNVSKYAYSVAVRALYITENGKFDGDMISPLLRSFGQYDVIGRNGIGPLWRTDFNYNFFQDISGKRKMAAKKTELEFYKARYYLPGDKKTFYDKEKLMSVEELATMFHIPGSSVITPNLGRVETTRKEAPANLPTGSF
jgi:hypothetical protein